MLSGGEQQRIVKLLSDLAHVENTTVIIMTRDISISEIADDVLQMQDGRL